MGEIICRICLSQESGSGSEWSSVFEKISQKTVLQIMMEFANLKISKHDLLPKTICHKCSENLKLLNAFRDLIIESDLILRKKYLNFRRTDSHFDLGSNVSSINVNGETEASKYVESKLGLDSTLLESELNIKTENDKSEEVKNTLKNKKDLESSKTTFFNDTNNKIDLGINVLNTENPHLNIQNESKAHEEKAEKKNHIQHNIKNNCKKTKRKSRKTPTLYEIALKLKKTKRNIKSLRRKTKTKSQESYKTTENESTKSHYVKEEVTEKVNNGETRCEITDIQEKLVDNLDEFSQGEDYDDPNFNFDQEKYSEKFQEKSKRKIDRSHMGKAKCPICNHVSINKYVLRQHIRLKHEMDNGKKAYCCDQCPKRYINNYQLKVHQNSHTGAKPYPCDMCDRKFKSPTAARLHKQLQHIADKKWKCFDCQKGFISQHMLQNHVRQVHTKERPFLCEICSKGFAAKGMLTTHIKSVHVRETEPCPVCKKEYNVFSMKVHLLSHQGVRNHVCETCGNAFTTKGSLKAHKFIHTGEKPNVCQICGKGFIQKQSLKKHIMSHSDLRPFLCNLCNETYKYRQDLIRHMKKHQKEQEK